MAQKPESTFIASVHRYLPLELHAEKMNNPYSSGTPDVYYSGNKADLWCEYKFFPKLPVRSPTLKADLSPLQLKWLRGRYTEGRNVFVIVGCPAGGVVLSNLEWENPVPLITFTSRIISRAALAEWLSTATLETPYGPTNATRNLRRTRKTVACDERPTDSG